MELNPRRDLIKSIFIMSGALPIALRGLAWLIVGKSTDGRVITFIHTAVIQATTDISKSQFISNYRYFKVSSYSKVKIW